jgi:2',3'-cyclic-nucleotide 2'-phosphodiesterase (5'-nucleotidase family)
MINAGLLLGPLTGDVTDYDLLTICPHPINPCVIELTGKELQEVLLQTKDENLPHRQIRGLGFRGTVMGVFVYDRISFQEKKIFIDGRELDLEGNYTLALPDMFTFGHFFKEVFQHKEKKYFLPEFLRDLLKWKLQMQP